jgi:hypothetical protein
MEAELSYDIPELVVIGQLSALKKIGSLKSQDSKN